MATKEEFLAEDHKELIFSDSVGVSLSYNDVDYTISALRYNEAADGLVMSLTWRIGDVEEQAHGIMIRGGVNMVAQLDTKLPSLVAVNKTNRGENITSIDDLSLFIIVDFYRYFIKDDS